VSAGLLIPVINVRARYQVSVPSGSVKCYKETPTANLSWLLLSSEVWDQ